MGKRRWRHLDRDTRRQIIKLAAGGATYEQIKGQLDRPLGSISLVLRRLGGVIRKEHWQCSRYRLSLEERVEIYLGLEAGLTFTAIAAKLGRAVSTVSREVHNHGGRGRYAPVRAHRAAEAAARRP